MTSSIAGIVAHSCWVNCFNFASCISPSQGANLLLRDEFRKTSKDSLEKAAVTGFWGTSGCSFRFTPPTIWCLVGSPCEGKEHSKILKKKQRQIGLDKDGPPLSALSAYPLPSSPATWRFKKQLPKIPQWNRKD